MMVKISWQMTLVTFIAVPLFTVVNKSYGVYYDKLNKKVQTMLARANVVADEVRVFSLSLNRAFQPK